MVSERGYLGGERDAWRRGRHGTAERGAAVAGQILAGIYAVAEVGGGRQLAAAALCYAERQSCPR